MKYNLESNIIILLLHLIDCTKKCFQKIAKWRNYNMKLINKMDWLLLQKSEIKVGVKVSQELPKNNQILIKKKM